MFTSKARDRIRSLEAQLEEEKAMRRALIDRVNRLERDVEDVRSDSRSRGHARALEAPVLRE